MTSIDRELRRLVRVLIWRGIALLFLGVGALIWPEPFLVAAMVIVGITAVLFGIYEISIALAIRSQRSGWRMVFVHGIAILAFGLMTVGAPGLPIAFALGVIASWFFLYAGVVFVGASFVWPMRAVRWALVMWGAFDIALAVLVMLYPLGTMLALLGFGAVYASLFGIWQIALGVWLRRRLDGPAGAVFRQTAGLAHR